MDVKYRVYGSWERFLYLDDSLTDKEIVQVCMDDYTRREPENIGSGKVDMLITEEGISFNATAKVSLNPTISAIEIAGDDQ